MKIISWNVNGIRAGVKKGFVDKVSEMAPEILCLQETKASEDQVKEALSELKDYHLYADEAQKKGYSGTAILTKEKPISVSKGLGINEHDQEGRVTTIELEDFFVVSCYTPNSQNELARLPYRKTWDQDIKDYLLQLNEKKPVIYCGDLNVAHQEIDIARPKANYNKTAGFTQDEMDGMTRMLKSGFVDTFRSMHPTEVKYSWWSFRGQARAKNIGWRLDYVLVSERLFEKVKSAFILNEIEGSDHCPVGIELK